MLRAVVQLAQCLLAGLVAGLIAGRVVLAAQQPAVAPTDVAAPTVTMPPAAGELRQTRLSHYAPWQGGVNCARFVGGQCVSRMASGEAWQAWINRAAACPLELPFWTLIVLPGGEVFVCLDRGGKIVTEPDGTIWIDLLLAGAPPVPFGTPVEVRVIWP